MSKSQNSKQNRKFLFFSALVILLASFIIISLESRANRPITRTGKYIANTLYNNKNYSTAALSLVMFNLQDTDSRILRVKAEIEAGELGHTQSILTKLHADNPNRRDITLMLGAYYSLSDNTLAMRSLVADQSDPHALEALNKLNSNNLTKAQELYVLGLLNSSKRILDGDTQESAEKYLLYARINLALDPNKKGATNALEYLVDCLRLNPTNNDAQMLLKIVRHETVYAYNL
jgi:hypothetical protein